MGRDSTGALTVNECRRIELSFLIKSGLLRKAATISSILTWTGGSKIKILCNYKDNERYIRLSYIHIDMYGEEQNYDYKIYLHSIPSNLGKGEVLYFICPISYKRCRILYSAYGSPVYKSRNAYTNKIYYRNQISSKYDYWLDRWHTVNDKLAELKNQPVKSHYKGKATRLQQRIEYLENLLQYYDERREDIFIRRIANWGTYLFK